MKILIRLSLYIAVLSSVASAQTGSIKGRITSEGKPVSFMTVGITELGIGTVSENDGSYELKNIPFGTYRFKTTGVGFEPYTVNVNVKSAAPVILNVRLSSSETALDEVVVTGTMKETSKLESPIPVEVYNASFFRKNPTPNVFEALSMVNGVQPQLNCNICNTGDIHINGMEGPYTMVLIDGMPIVSSLSTVYGLSGIPNGMVKRIEVVKGPASTLYGSEAVGGLINIITRDPGSSPLLRVDVSGTSWQEYNTDISTKIRLGNATSLVGVNAYWFDAIYDTNRDGFTDVPIQKRVSLFNKWDFERKSRMPATIAMRLVHENRWGGQTTWTPEWRGTDSIYGESIYTNRVELIGTYGLPVKSESIRLQYSCNYHHQNSYYGFVKYFGEQHTAFAQLLWDRRIGRHDLLLGVPFRYTFYDDNTPGTASARIDPVNKPQQTYLPGVFAQDEWAMNRKLTTLVGLRYDHNNIHGHILTPRLSFKYKPSPAHTIRLSGGNGYRVVNLFTEDHAALTGAREVVIAEALKPEQSWNANLNYTTQINHKIGFVTLDASIFYTYFTNKIIGDYRTDATKIIYDNLDGYAISRGITLNTDFAFTNGFKISAGTTIMDVFQVEKDSIGVNRRTEQMFAPKVSGTFAVSYTFNKIGLGVDLTGKLNGPMHLPVLPGDYRPGMSPWYCLMNIQLTKKIGKNMEIYGGLKNLLNFLPKDPLIRPFDPFNKYVSINNPNGYTFDPSYNYAPVQGIRGFLGMRYNLY